MPQFTNTCPITFDQITTEDSYLVKVPKGAPKNENDKPQDKYYYIGERDTLMHLQNCPLTKRNGEYFVVKLSKLSDDQIATLLEEGKTEKFTEDNNILSNKATALSGLSIPQTTHILNGAIWNAGHSAQVISPSVQGGSPIAALR